MKKAICILGAAVFCAGWITACGASAGQMLSAGAEGDSGAQIVQKVYAKEYPSKDGKVILGNYSYTVPVMTAAADDAASEQAAEVFNDTIGGWVEEKAEDWDEAMENAQSWYDETRQDEWDYYGQWKEETTCRTNITETMVSMRFSTYVYTGGAHGYAYCTSMLFDMQNGAFVELEELTDDDTALTAAVSDEILRQIDENDLAVQFAYWNEYPVYVEKWDEDHSIFFNEAGELELIFHAYELASYAAGDQAFTIAQDVYAPYLNDYGKQLLGIV